MRQFIFLDMRACRLFVDALKEDFEPYLTIDFLFPNEFSLDERFELKQKLDTLKKANKTYEDIWEDESTRLDKRIVSFQETTQTFTTQFGMLFILSFLVYFSTTNEVSIAIAATIQCICAIIGITCWAIFYGLTYQRKLLNSIK